MVREVVDHGDAADNGADLKTPLYAHEGGKSGLNRLSADALRSGKSGRGRCVERVVLAGQAHGELGPQRAAAPHLPARHVFAIFNRVTKVLNAPIRGGREAVTLHAAERAGDAFSDVGTAVVGYDDAAAKRTRFTRRSKAVFTASRSA